MSKISSIIENDEISHNSSIQDLSQKFLYFSDQKPNLSTLNQDEEFISSSNGFNSCSLNGKNKLFKSFITSKNNKNKELSLIYLIKTFNKPYSNESKGKNKIILDLPKISKNLFSNSHIIHKISINLDVKILQKTIHLSKRGNKIVNNFFSNIYSSGEISNNTFSPQKCPKNKFSFNSGNKINDCDISPFTHLNNKYKLFDNSITNTHSSNSFNFDLNGKYKINGPVNNNKDL